MKTTLSSMEIADELKKLQSHILQQYNASLHLYRDRENTWYKALVKIGEAERALREI